MITVEDLPEPDAAGKENVFKGSLLPTLNKKLIANSLNVIYGILQKCNNKHLTTEISSFLSVAVYKALPSVVFRQMAKTRRVCFRFRSG